MSTEVLDRKRRTRAAHRGSATRIMGQIEENLGSGDDLDRRRLEQQRLSLSEKLRVLSRLDDELLELVDVEELDSEVEQADVIREKIGLCLLDVDRALKCVGSGATDGGSMGPEDHSSVRTRTVGELTLSPSPRPIARTVETSSPSPHAVSGSSDMRPAESDGMPHVAISGTHMDASRVEQPERIVTPTLTMTTPHVKLPKLTIKKFDGDLTRWVSFWDSFNSSIHSNPSLSDVDKFNYLNSFLESTAAESIAGLTLTSANYEEAVATLKKRFGNAQLIISRHMDALLNLPVIGSHQDLRGLRRLRDKAEAHVRGLRALGVSAGSYGGMLVSILMNKLPPDIRLVVSRELSGEWDIDQMMGIIDREVDARERSCAVHGSDTTSRRLPHKSIPTAAALMTSNPKPSSPYCVYCGGAHQSSSCVTVSSVEARREALRKGGRCYVCLKKHHISRDCRSSTNCSRCRGRHHPSICQRVNVSTDVVASPSPTPGAQGVVSNQGLGVVQRSTSSLYIGSQTPILLQTAKLELHRVDDGATRVQVRALLDAGSQRTYMTCRVKDQLQLQVKRTERLCIKTFAASGGGESVCEVVEFGLSSGEGMILKVDALVVPRICDPLTSQPITSSTEHYSHLLGLELADSATVDDLLEVDVLIGSDTYWRLVTGEVRRGRRGPTAIRTKVGWVLSGPASCQETSANLVFTTTHALKIEAHPTEPSLDDQLRQFWELESLGIVKNEPSVYESFVQQITFDGKRYQVGLPWKEGHLPLPDNLELCRRRLRSLLRRLRQDPQLLTQYNFIIEDQVRRGIVEVVKDEEPSDCAQVHYLPHHGVVRRDKTTSRLRIVYDASARGNGPSLNDCLYTGPSFGQSIFDILLRFRLHRVALAGDIEKAFLMISVEEGDRDSLRFLWVSDIESDEPCVVTLRFARVVFGVSSSPFLLNATIKHHMETYRDIDPLFVDKFLNSIYVDDVSLGADDVKSSYELYLKSKFRLSEAGFKLRKFVTNSSELREQIEANEQPTPDSTTSVEEDQSYAKGVLGPKASTSLETHKVLGVQWNFVNDSYVFDVDEVSRYMVNTEPTKRNVVSMTARFFDPLGVVSPVTVRFKTFFQRLCEAGIDWDDALTGDLLNEWDHLCSTLRESKPVVIPRCYLSGISGTPQSAKLVGFCDSSTKAYAAVVYLRIQNESQVDVRFVAAKTRVCPRKGITIPRLELLSALLLSKLVTSVRASLGCEMRLDNPLCFTDSQVSLCWIRGCGREWKQFVENRVTSIRALVPPQRWRHCPGSENPADIPTRGATAAELSRNHLWLNGPEWINTLRNVSDETEPDPVVPEECFQEMKAAHTLVATQSSGMDVEGIIKSEDISSFRKLLRITALVLKFIHLLRQRIRTATDDVPSSDADYIDRARLYWIRASQARLQQDSNFPLWRRQLGLFQDESQLWRCGGRMLYSDLPPQSKAPILLDKKHHLTTLIVLDAHRRVIHGGVKETLTELRSAFWLVRGRQFVRKLIHRCLICRRYEGRPYQDLPPPPLPEFRVSQSRPFTNTGVDFAGPMYVRPSTGSTGPKVWLCLYTCCVTRAVHLDLVPDLSAITFIRSFKRFTARRGIPAKVVSDNGKTFKSAANIIQRVLNDSAVKAHFTDLQVKWSFNLERAPWWGGMFERLIRSAKRCLKKTVGRACLTYDELLTIATDVEGVLNSRPLTYVSTDDQEEPLTPSHLMVGYRVMSLPDVPFQDDPNYNETPDNLNRRMKHLIRTSKKFWSRWRREYLSELREAHRSCRRNKGVKEPVKEGAIVIVYEQGSPRGLWRIGRIERVIKGHDGGARAAHVRVQSRNGRPIILKRPIQHLYPLEIASAGKSEAQGEGSNPSDDPESAVEDHSEELCESRPQRAAAIAARDRILCYNID